MSLILDALRKADAERERGAVPSLHSHPVVPASEEGVSKPRARLNLLWIAIGASVGLLGAAAMWVLVGRGAPPAMQAARVEAPAAVVAPSGSTAPPPAASGSPQPLPQAPAIAPPPAPAVASESAPVAEPAPWRAPDERKTTPPEPKDAPVRVLGNAPPASPAQAPVYSRDQLPPDIRTQLPQLTIGGSIYSPVPSGRSLIVNGQLFRERDRLTSDLTLEEIGLKAAVFSFRGYRFEVQF